MVLRSARMRNTDPDPIKPQALDEALLRRVVEILGRGMKMLIIQVNLARQATSYEALESLLNDPMRLRGTGKRADVCRVPPGFWWK